MTIPNPNGFRDGEYLKVVRESYLNPLISKVEKSISPRLDTLEPEVQNSFKDVTLDETSKTLNFTRGGTADGKPIDLTPILPVVPPPVDPTITVVDSKSSGEISYPNINTLKFNGNLVVSSNYPGNGKPGYVRVSSPGPWAKIGAGALTPVVNFTVLDPNGKSKIDAKTLTVVIPEDKTKLSTKVGSGDFTSVEKLAIIGNLGSTEIVDGTLTLELPVGGGSGTVTNQNFKGFFSNLGDLTSQVNDPMNDRSYAFVRDEKFAGLVYTPYFYVNSNWSELNTDPAITYEGISGTTKGVFSIKPDPKITIDSTGQLDLSKLGEDNGYFHGFFESVDSLTTAVPNPSRDRSFAYVQYNNAYVGRRWAINSDTGQYEWKMVAPIGGITLVHTASDGSKQASPMYGINKNNLVDVDANGIITIKGSEESEIKVEITDADGVISKSGSFKTVQYAKGKSNVSLEDSTKKLTIQHPQQVITYDSNFEAAHNSQEFKGNIYYDETSRCWMGWGTPETSGGVDVKWTRIAHPKMSDEVKDLSRRMPRKAPNVTPGILGDAPVWEYNSWTYVKKDDSQLPEAFREKCGAYFITIIQDVENDTPRPQERYQICYADEVGATSYVRRWKRTDTTGEYGWQPWVKISMSAKDISDHNTDHTSHRDSFKFYKVGTLDMSWATLKAKNWVIGDSDLLLLADSDGVSVDGASSISVPYTGTYRFSGRLDFDGLNTSSPYPKPNFILYVYKTVNSVASIISEHAYSHPDHTKPVPPLQWKSGEIQLNEGDKIHFELKDFKTSLEALSGLRFIPNRNFFVMEDSRTTAGSRIAETFRRTLGALNSHYNVGVNVHYTSGTSGPVRVYGAAVSAQATNMTKVKG